MDFDKVKREHILLGIKDFEQKGIPPGFKNSTTYNLVYNGKLYPPKVVMVYANFHASRRKIEWYFKGGEGTECFEVLRKNGFNIEKKNNKSKEKNGKIRIIDILNEIDLWEDWLKSYNYYVPLFIKEAKSKPLWSDWNNEIFNQFFEQSNNQCVASLQQGYFTYNERDKIKENWLEIQPLLKKIAETQNTPLWNDYKTLKSTVRKFTEQNRKAATNRLIASLQPHLLCTVVNEYHLGELFRLLNKHVTDPVPKYQNDWFKDSNAIVTLFKSVMPSQDYMEKLITYPWQVLEFLREKNKSMTTIKDKFLDWFYNKSIQKYSTVNRERISQDLDESNSFFEENIFNVNKNNYLRIIEIINKARKDKGGDFYQFSASLGNHRPGALLGKENYQKFLKEYFSLSDNFARHNIKIKKALNKILYGPPGTGKTFKLQREYFDKFTKKETTLNRSQFIENIVSELSWWQVVAIAVLDLKTPKVSEIFAHEIIQKKAQLSNSKTVRQTIWGQLQSHTVMECENVNVQRRLEPLLFYKRKNSTWTINHDFLEESFPEAFDILASTKNFKPNPDKLIRNYEFVTFHQSFGYEDFIEGIKPVMEEGIPELTYEIQDGVFKKLCMRAQGDPDNQYAIFIDEINRGNVSSIFGELITLVETDKRIGEENEMTAILPYSKQSFGVPRNIHIIGTMNTADRSVEALDTALRRRFVFEEIMPNPSLLNHIVFDGFNMEEVLKTINERIEVLLDRDHTIGHSYFISLNSGDSMKLKSIFANNIIPLLQEYFYHDYEKIALILGEGFVEPNKLKINFATFKEIDTPESETKYQLRTHITDIEKAVRILLNQDEQDQ